MLFIRCRGVDACFIPPLFFLSPPPLLQAEAGAPDILARLSNACAKIGGNDASKLAPVACFALELLFTLERCRIYAANFTAKPCGYSAINHVLST